MLGKVVAGLSLALVIGGALVFFLRAGPKEERSGVMPKGESGHPASDERELASTAPMRAPVVPAVDAAPPAAESVPTEVVAVVDTPQPGSASEAETPELWKEHYKDLPLEILDEDHDRLSRKIAALTKDEMQRRYKLGFGEFVADGKGKFALDEVWDEAVITNLIVEAGGAGVYRVTLPRDEFPEAYALQDKLVWLTHELSRRPRKSN